MQIWSIYFSESLNIAYFVVFWMKEYYTNLQIIETIQWYFAERFNTSDRVLADAQSSDIYETMGHQGFEYL